MKKKNIFFVLSLLASGLLFTFISSFTSISAVSYASDDRYANMDTSSASALFYSCREAANEGWTKCSYSNLPAKLRETDYDTEGLDDPARPNRMVDIYSATSNYSKTDNKSSYSKEGDMWNREHIVPKSWWGGGDSGPSGEGGDAFNMYPTDGYNNGIRSNYVLGETANPTYTSNEGFCKLGPSSFSGYSGTVFEVNDKYKGDVARAYFYFVTKFNNAYTYTTSEGSYVFSSQKMDTNFGLTDYAKNLFYKWHKLDPVSAWEKKRCDNIEVKQGNRNPYIDHPEYVDAIWGDSVIDPVSVTGVSLNKVTAEIKIDESFSLIAAITPNNATNKSLTWSSSNASIASVDATGLVKGLKEGNATITVTTSDGGYTANCSILVKTNESIVPVESIYLDKTNEILSIGDSFTLKETILPSNATDPSVTWSSSDEDIATVDNGEVKALKAGEVNIMVTSNDGNKTATCHIVVQEVISVNSIALDQHNLTLSVDQTYSFTVTFNPDDASDKSLLWVSLNPDIVKVENGVITALKEGVTSVIATSNDGSHTDTCKIVVLNTSKGCGGSIIAPSAIISLLSLSSGVILLIKKRRG